MGGNFPNEGELLGPCHKIRSMTFRLMGVPEAKIQIELFSLGFKKKSCLDPGYMFAKASPAGHKSGNLTTLLSWGYFDIGT